MGKVTVRRWQIVAAFLSITVAYTLGLWALKHTYDVDRRGRAERAQQLHREEIATCQSRHNLAVAILFEDEALVRAEATSLQQFESVKHFPGLTDRQVRQARQTAERLLAKLRKAHRLAVVADCRRPPLPLS